MDGEYELEPIVRSVAKVDDGDDRPSLLDKLRS